MDSQSVLRLSAGFAAGVVVLSSAEILVSIRDYDRGGVFDCRVNPPSLRLQSYFERRSRPSPTPTLRFVQILVVARMLAALVLLIPGISMTALAFCAGFCVVTGFVLLRLTSGYTEWGEQLVKVVLAAATLGWLGGVETTVRWAVWFLAAHASLAYCAAGTFKLGSPIWRSGDALWRILSLQQAGHRPLGEWLRQHSRWGLLISWGTILFEVTFPLALIAPPAAMFCWLGAGALFHLGCAFAMGLNTYLWAFVATYPAIVFVNYSLRAWLF